MQGVKRSVPSLAIMSGLFYILMLMHFFLWLLRCYLLLLGIFASNVGLLTCVSPVCDEMWPQAEPLPTIPEIMGHHPYVRPLVYEIWTHIDSSTIFPEN